MAKEHVDQILISKRTVQIGNQVYPLANISRVQSVRLIPRGRASTFHPLREMLVLVVVAAALLAGASTLRRLDLPIGSAVERTVQTSATVVAIVAGLRIAYLLVVLIHRMFFRPPRYALIIETSGTQYTALSGTDRDEIDRIQSIIVDAIEDPPTTVQSFTVNNLDMRGSQGVQVGSNNRQTNTY